MPHIDVDHFRYAFEVNVTAPLDLSQRLLPRLRATAARTGVAGRILHLGTGVAHNVQRGSGTYGITKKVRAASVRAVSGGASMRTQQNSNS